MENIRIETDRQPGDINLQFIKTNQKSASWTRLVKDVTKSYIYKTSLTDEWFDPQMHSA